MKKQLLYLLLFFAFVSCQEEIKFNNPSMQGQKDNVFWRAIDTRAVLSTNGSMTIEGYTRNEKLILKTTSTIPQTYVLGTGILNTVTYILTDVTGTITFSTGTGIGEGQIIIEEYDPLNKTVTGTFRFNAENVTNNPLAESILNFQYGVFYKVPVSSPTTL